MKKRTRYKIIIATVALLSVFCTPYPFKILRRIKATAVGIISQKKIVEIPPTFTAEDQISTYGESAHARLKAAFQVRGIAYPPQRLALVAIKCTRQLQLYAAPAGGAFKFVCSYPILGASGVLGPKLREGDRQVPEGIYNLYLEPNTPYHLALRLNYPNPTDWAHAKLDGRENPGSDILIHGNVGSIGCLAMGDPVSEELFVAAYDTPDKNLELIIAPLDFRVEKFPQSQPTDPTWLPELYHQIKVALKALPVPR